MTAHRRRTQAEKDAYARWAVRRRRLQSLGQWNPFMDSEPVRAHIQALQAAGMPELCVTKVLGLPPGAFRSLMRGSGLYGPTEKTVRETGEAVLAFWPTLDDFPDHASIDPAGTRRRAHALVSLGWPQAELARMLSRPVPSVNESLRGERVSARFARSMRRLYDELWDQRPEDYGVSLQVANRARNHARAEGYCGPLAWDDDTIDDPAAVPQTDAAPAGCTEGDDVVNRFLIGESVVLDRDGQREAITHLMEWTYLSLEEIADRMEMSPDAVARSWERIKRRARDAGCKAPWRRVYVPVCDMDLTRDDMRSAA